MAIVTRQQQHFLFDRAQPPALAVQPGADVIFETLDACCGEVRTVEQFLKRRGSGRPSNPLAGPVWIEGAEPGDTLIVDLLGVELDETGFQIVGPNRAMIADEVPEWRCYEVRTTGDRVILPNGLAVRADPVIGSFGNAPAGPPTQLANPLGGNVDAPAARAGARLYIPVAVPGALFSLGDVHACQGDGEVVGAPEIGARVTARLSLGKYRHSEWFMIEDETHWHSACTAPTEAQAAKLAVFQNARFVSKMQGIDFADAMILLTMVGSISIARTGLWGANDPVVCASFPKEILKSL